MEGRDFSSYEDLEVESCPHIGWDDAQRSACVTRIFREYLLPRLWKGMPQFGVHPIEPYLKDVLNFTVVNIGILHWSCTVRDLVVTGFGNLSRADIVYDTPGRSLTLNLEFPRIEGHSARTTVDGHMFGIPTRYFTQEGSIAFYIDGFTLVAKFLITPKRAEFFELLNVYTEFRDVLGQQKGLAKPAWVGKSWPLHFSVPKFRLFSIHRGVDELVLAEIPPPALPVRRETDFH